MAPRLSLDYIRNSLKLTAKHFPEMYLGMGYFTLAFGFYFHELYHHLYVEDTTINRYKRKYTVLRPDDLRTKFYPKYYVTDQELLPEDHPKTTFEGVENMKKILLGEGFNNRV